MYKEIKEKEKNERSTIEKKAHIRQYSAKSFFYSLNTNELLQRDENNFFLSYSLSFFLLTFVNASIHSVAGDKSKVVKHACVL